MSMLLHKNARVDLLGNAVIPAGTTVIGRMAFYKCHRLRRVRIPGMVERIEELVKLLNPMHPEESFVGAAMRGVLDVARGNIEYDFTNSMQESMEITLRD